MIGAQLFINRSDTVADVQRGLRQMGENGFRLVRLFISWDLLERRPGCWNWDLFDAAFDEAGKAAIGVIPTLMAYSPPGWMGATKGPQDIGDLENPGFRRQARNYVRRVVTRWRAHPALHSWILWNEPMRELTRTPATLRLFRRFLRKRSGGDIERVNAEYFRWHSDFSTIGNGTSDAGFALDFRGYRERLDWIEFTTERLMQTLRHLAAQVRTLDSVHSIHVNPHNVSQCLLGQGQSVWREADLVDFIGCSAHPAWHSVRFQPERAADSVGMFADIARSATRHPEGAFWVSELQGGPTVFSAIQPLVPSEGDISQWLWESIGAGAGAVLFWCFNSRTDGYEAGEWSLLGQDSQPSERLCAASTVAAFLKRNSGLFLGCAPRPPDVWILWSEASQSLALVEGSGDNVSNPRNRQMAADAGCGAYLMSRDLGLNAGFVTEMDLQAAAAGLQTPRAMRFLSGGKILLVPGATALDHGTLRALETLTASGWMIVADGLVGWKTPGGSLSDKESRRRLNDLFGSAVHDFQPVGGKSPTCRHEDGEFAAWFIRVLWSQPPKDASGQWSDGLPVATTRACGAGCATRIGTVFFQRYFIEPTAAARHFLRDMLEGFVQPGPAVLIEPDEALRLRWLEGKSHWTGVMCNRGVVSRQVALSTPAAHDCLVIDPQTGEAASFEYTPNCLRIPMPPDSIRILRIRKS